MTRKERNFTEEDDRDLERRLVNYLLGYKMPALRQVRVEVDNGTVVLRGTVSSYHQRQLCINCCRRVAGVIKLVDQIHVVAASDPQFVPV